MSGPQKTRWLFLVSEDSDDPEDRDFDMSNNDDGEENDYYNTSGEMETQEQLLDVKNKSNAVKNVELE